jgi:hypothetical protein
MVRPTLAIPALLLLLAACSERKAPVDGVGPWHIGKSTLAEDGGRCETSETPVWCFEMQIGIAGHSAEPNLYYASADPTAPLTEILLSLSGCRDGEVRAWLEQSLGKPTASSEKRATWKTRTVFVAAGLPAEPGRCEINFVAPTDTKRIAELEAR